MSHATDLILCTAALVLGPIVYQVSKAKRSTYALVDGFVLVGVGGLVLLEILPRTFASIGLYAIPLAIFGFIFPHFLEHRLNSLPVSPRTILSSLIILGLVTHQLLDGVGLSRTEIQDPGADYALTTLGIAIILHQVPKGFLLWEISKKAGGVWAAMIVIAGLVAATSLGFFMGSNVLGLVEHNGVVGFQAFVAGGLLHVVVHHVSGGAAGKPHSSTAFWSGAGALAAVGLLAWLPHTEFVDVHGDLETGFRTALFRLTVESAPPILVGFLAAGILQAFVSLKSLQWLRGANSLSSALRGVVLGIPLPICSCGVTPVYHALIRRGVPAAAAVAFLIATPEIGLDSFFLSFRLLGARVTFIRLGMAFCVALLTSVLLSRLFSHVEGRGGGGNESLASDVAGQPFSTKLRNALSYATTDLVDHLGAWIAAGLVIAAFLEPLLEPRWFTGLPAGADVVILALVGLPIYVCASGATPLAAVLLSKGVSTGAVLAFLITGPTTNVTTFGLLSRLHGRRRALTLVTIVFALSVLLGLAANAIPQEGPAAVTEAWEHEQATFEKGCAIVLLVLLAVSVLRMGPRRFLGSLLGEASLGDSGESGGGASSHGHNHDHDGHGAEHEAEEESGCGCGSPAS